MTHNMIMTNFYLPHFHATNSALNFAKYSVTDTFYLFDMCLSITLPGVKIDDTGFVYLSSP